MPWTLALASLVSAAVANAQGDGTAAATSLRAAIAQSEATGMATHAASARHQLGLLLGGAEGQELVREGRDAMAAQDVLAPARFATMWVPGRWGAES